MEVRCGILKGFSLLLHQYISKFLQQGNKNRIVVKSVSLALGLAVLAATLFVGSGMSAHAATVCKGTAYTVRPGDTLSGIAARYGKNWHDLASSNGIADPNLIFVNQQICLSGNAQVKAQAVSQVPAQPASVQQKAAPAAPAVQGSVPNMIRQVFGSDAGSALNIASCESGFNPNATNASSGAAGVFQFLRSTWASTSQAGQSPYNAYANIVAAHEVFVRDGHSWREWQCQP